MGMREMEGGGRSDEGGCCAVLDGVFELDDCGDADGELAVPFVEAGR